MNRLAAEKGFFLIDAVVSLLVTTLLVTLLLSLLLTASNSVSKTGGAIDTSIRQRNEAAAALFDYRGDDD